MSLETKTAPAPTSTAAERYSRGTALSLSLIGTGLVLACANSALEPGSFGPLLSAAFTLILIGVSTWTAAAYVHDRATETTNGR